MDYVPNVLEAMLTLRRVFRGALGRLSLNKIFLLKLLLDRRKLTAVHVIQGPWRRALSRMAVKYARHVHRLLDNVEQGHEMYAFQDYGAMSLQRIARGFIARRTAHEWRWRTQIVLREVEREEQDQFAAAAAAAAKIQCAFRFHFLRVMANARRAKDVRAADERSLVFSIITGQRLWRGKKGRFYATQKRKAFCLSKLPRIATGLLSRLHLYTFRCHTHRACCMTFQRLGSGFLGRRETAGLYASRMRVLGRCLRGMKVRQGLGAAWCRWLRHWDLAVRFLQRVGRGNCTRSLMEYMRGRTVHAVIKIQHAIRRFLVNRRQKNSIRKRLQAAQRISLIQRPPKKLWFKPKMSKAFLQLLAAFIKHETSRRHDVIEAEYGSYQLMIRAAALRIARLPQLEWGGNTLPRLAIKASAPKALSPLKLIMSKKCPPKELEPSSSHSTSSIELPAIPVRSMGLKSTSPVLPSSKEERESALPMLSPDDALAPAEQLRQWLSEADQCMEDDPERARQLTEAALHQTAERSGYFTKRGIKAHWRGAAMYTHGVLLRHEGRNDEALHQFRQALKLSLGARHGLQARLEVSDLLVGMGEGPAAMPYAKAALEEAYHLDDKELIAVAMLSLYRAQSAAARTGIDHTAARAMLEKALRVATTSLGPDHSTTIRIREETCIR